MSKIFICQAGADLDTPEGRHEELGIIGMAYYWGGEWIRSPHEVKNRERNPVMKLRPVFGPNVEVYGDVGCFRSILECEHYMEENS